MEIRRLQPSDADAYRALRLRALREHPQAFTSSWEEDSRRPPAATVERLASPDFTCFGAFGGGELVGIAGLERRQRAKERHKAVVAGMYVAPDVAGQGVGAALLGQVLAQARADGLLDLVLTVTEGNNRALRLYERAGFRVFGTEPRAIRVGAEALAKVHMHLPLA